MRNILVAILAAIMLTACGQTVAVWNESTGAMMEFSDKQSAHMHYEYTLKSEANANKWEAISMIEEDNIIGGMLAAFELGKNENPEMSRFIGTEERAYKWVKLILGGSSEGGPGYGIRNLLGEVDTSGNGFNIKGNRNNIEFYNLDSRRDTVLGANDDNDTSTSTQKTITTEYERVSSDNDNYNFGE